MRASLILHGFVAFWALVASAFAEKGSDPAGEHSVWSNNGMAVGNRRWRWKRQLTYAFGRIPETRILSADDVRFAVGSAFASWAGVVGMGFAEIEDLGSADIKIEFVEGDHGDGSPFDGRLGIVSHAFAPEDGRFHLDGAETWTADMSLTDDESAIDLQTVAVHEIGHVIGLGHSSVEAAVMFPSVEGRDVKRRLTADDIEAARALYGPPPHSSAAPALPLPLPCFVLLCFASRSFASMT